MHQPWLHEPTKMTVGEGALLTDVAQGDRDDYKPSLACSHLAVPCIATAHCHHIDINFPATLGQQVSKKRGNQVSKK